MRDLYSSYANDLLKSFRKFQWLSVTARKTINFKVDYAPLLSQQTLSITIDLPKLANIARKNINQNPKEFLSFPVKGLFWDTVL